MTFEEYAEDWIRRQSRGWAQNSEKRVRSDMRTHIIPRLGSRKVGTFTSIALDDFILSMAQGKRDPALDGRRQESHRGRLRPPPPAATHTRVPPAR
ncbi:phage integrase central domain-containing protein [Streptomyces sp. NPDC093097]|uniref:phage integrase central domain-containing protein n=1 Tax=Streptomyces sp. NPDC093097 TaxID=3366027 RepID=UPI00380B6D12